ncbi:DUF1801 domain-containing protein [Pelomonas sp. APW6]|uniref:DUF1801 domain-containing protein n=1 Tax=Roseateles subflavus TaxID=3053353 RepID=A0ABT7LG88_9BURK|nr:DUF1801 domain-containing protein [Pelomonas sp. APW6]MDL5031859.1 DUF1801 domain-containing protein [Pelomonas sp. APW6]
MTEERRPLQKSAPALDPDAYLASLAGWQRLYVQAVRTETLAAAPLAETVTWGHLVYHSNGPVLLIRAEPQRVLFGFWRGQRLRAIEPRLRPGGKYEMATLELHADTPLERAVVGRRVREAVALNGVMGHHPPSPPTSRPTSPQSAAAAPRISASSLRQRGGAQASGAPAAGRG